MGGDAPRSSCLGEESAPLRGAVDSQLGDIGLSQHYPPQSIIYRKNTTPTTPESSLSDLTSLAPTRRHTIMAVWFRPARQNGPFPRRH